MQRHDQNPEDLLLDFHLDRLGDGDRVWIEAELLRDVELRGKSDRLGQMLRPLDHWSVPPAPANLVGKVLAGVEEASRKKGAAVSPYEEDALPRRSFTIPLREILAVAACIVLLAGVAIPGLSGIRGRAQGAICAGNLGSIFQGVCLYQQSFDESLPFAGRIAGAVWLPGTERDRPYASNSRHLYLLAKFNYVPDPKRFVCPADSTASPMRADDVAFYDDFASTRNKSYDSLNLSGAKPNLRPAMPIAYLSDRNPLFKDGRFDESVDPHTANSPVHKGRGQTVLTLDGSARWRTTPIYSANRDNLWLAGDIERYRGTESPTRNDDAHLVPGYPVTDPKVQRVLLR